MSRSEDRPPVEDAVAQSEAGVRAAPPLAPSQPPGPSGRLGDLARLLPILGAFLLISPLVRIFAVPLTVGGVPAIIWYIFGVWGALIVAAALLGRRVAAREDAAVEAAAETPAGGA